MQESGNVWILNYAKWCWINIVAGIIISVSVAQGDVWGIFFASIVLILSILCAVASLPIYSYGRQWF
jgi:hypothetical protein